MKQGSFGTTLQISHFEQLLELAPKLMEKTYESKVVLIRGLPPLSKEEFLTFCRTAAHNKSDEEAFVHWNVGMLMELKEHTSPENYLFSQEKVPYHWDGAFHETPGILVFNSLKSPKNGGETLFADTEQVIKRLSSEERQQLDDVEVCYHTEKLAHYGGDIQVKLLKKHPITQKDTLRLAEEVKTNLNPLTRSATQQKFNQLLQKLDDLLYQDGICLSHVWNDGDILLADNHSLLHGRNAFLSYPGEVRHLRRVQIR